MHFIFPMEGDVLNDSEGKPGRDGLTFTVRIAGDPDDPVSVNGVPCRFEEGEWRTEAAVGTALLLTAECKSGAETAAVFRFADAFRKYRLAIDDVTISLRNIAKDRPASVFDEPLFGFFGDLHRKYGAKIQFNAYLYDGEGFGLRDFPDSYRSEFDSCADWMRLTFHARADKPDHIYMYSGYGEMAADIDMTQRELERIAGNRITKCAANGLHHAETTREGARALRDRGMELLIGYFIFDVNGDPAVSYYLDREQTRHIARRDFWVDRSERIVFSRDKLVLDQHSPDEIPGIIDGMLRDQPQGAGILNFVTHEQYFYPSHALYLSDHRQRIEAAVRRAAELGYDPCFIDETAPRYAGLEKMLSKQGLKM